MSDKKSGQINTRFPEGLLELIDRDIDNSDEFRNRSDWLLAAARHYSEYRTKILAERKLVYNNDEKNEFENPTGGVTESLNKDPKKKNNGKAGGGTMTPLFVDDKTWYEFLENLPDDIL